MSKSGHVCFYCCAGADQTPDNPSRTDFCTVCGHRGEGIQRRLDEIREYERERKGE